MRSKQQTLDAVIDCGIVAVVRGESAEPVFKAIDAVLKGGVTVVEVTFTVPGALEIIRQLRLELPDNVVLGAGTVIDAKRAADAIGAGAEFLVAPNLNLDVIRTAVDAGKVVMPGALTPTEVVTAWQAGADLIKIFPANVMGPGYLKDLHGPLPQVRFIPTGGIDLSNAADYIKAGAAALGVGGSLIDKKLVAAGDWAALTDRARRFTEVIREARGSG
ncbi:MAG: bifunctional 4-hydroxy-2-oxoglutarate aldolase/2-dehydro-3-deoxy-phosphogluconate aldolase [Armatimonadota bacterium]|nr:bifunctional 4-hydroxy-2-oxoglutarate aldolase/2-dehydro-3-deoxy-phosphogluconate aldolase [Armatimonadota bacterium]